MKRLFVAIFVVLVFGISAFSQEKSLYDRLGGQPAIEAVVKDFAGNVLADSRINKKFAKSDANRLVKNLTDFVCRATGGPCKYTGQSMKAAHKKMAVTTGEFNALAEDLVALKIAGLFANGSLSVWTPPSLEFVFGMVAVGTPLLGIPPD